jgi:glycolate oxidase iron-sulfur subunit
MFSPRGRLNLLRAVEDGNLGWTAGVEAHLYHCLDCRACNTVCPPGIRIGELIIQGRVPMAAKRARPWLLRFMLEQVLISAERAEVLSAPMRLVQRLGLDRLGAGMLGWIPRLGPALRNLVQFTPRFAPPLRAQLPLTTPARSERRHRVAFFLGCMMNVAMPETSRATVRVLARMGCEVVTPRGQSCCGAPQDDQALRGLSRQFARRNIALFEPSLDEVDAVVTDCAGCSAALKEYADWLHDDPQWGERARRFSAKVRDVTEWLDSIWPDNLTARYPSQVRATYHDPCHLSNVQKVRQPPRRLLQRIQDLELRPLPDSFPIRCCGSAGIYNLTHMPMALELLDRKMNDIAATGAELVVSANPGCLLQLDWGRKRSKQPIRVKHVVQVLDESINDGS